MGECVACGGALKEFGKRGSYAYAVCSRCATLQQDPLPTPEQLNLAYREQYAKAGHYAFDFERAREANQNFHAQIVELLKRLPRPEGPVLDYGCGYGGLCELLEHERIDYAGYDLSRDEVEIARQRGLNVHLGDIRAVPPDLRASAMVMVFVLEHLAEYDDFLEACRRLVRPDGLLLVTIPTSMFIVKTWNLVRMLGIKTGLPAFNEAFTPPWHTVIFSPAGFRALMGRHGIVVERVLRSPKSRGRGLLRPIKRGLELNEKIGYALFGEKYPLMTAHTFVCRLGHK